MVWSVYINDISSSRPLTLTLAYSRLTVHLPSVDTLLFTSSCEDTQIKAERATLYSGFRHECKDQRTRARDLLGKTE